MYLILECECYKNDDVLRWDRGYLTADSRFPVIAIHASDLDGAKEWASYTLGPLECYSGTERPTGMNLMVLGSFALKAQM